MPRHLRLSIAQNEPSFGPSPLSLCTPRPRTHPPAPTNMPCLRPLWLYSCHSLHFRVLSPIYIFKLYPSSRLSPHKGGLSSYPTCLISSPELSLCPSSAWHLLWLLSCLSSAHKGCFGGRSGSASALGPRFRGNEWSNWVGGWDFGLSHTHLTSRLGTLSLCPVPVPLLPAPGLPSLPRTPAGPQRDSPHPWPSGLC